MGAAILLKIVSSVGYEGKIYVQDNGLEIVNITKTNLIFKAIYGQGRFYYSSMNLIKGTYHLYLRPNVKLTVNKFVFFPTSV